MLPDLRVGPDGRDGLDLQELLGGPDQVERDPLDIADGKDGRGFKDRLDKLVQRVQRDTKEYRDFRAHLD